MTTELLLEKFKAAGIPAYLDAVPAGATRFVGMTPILSNAIRGGDSVLLESEVVQLDICAPTRYDNIVNDVKDVLQNDFIIWETDTPMSYDSEFKLYRAILSVELY